MQLNLHKLDINKDLVQIVDTINLNFEQILLNGGGPVGPKGMIGPPGIPGKQGLKGNTGDVGPAGSSVRAYDTVTSTSFGIEDLSLFETYGSIVNGHIAPDIATAINVKNDDLVVNVKDGELFIYQYHEREINSLKEGWFEVKDSGQSSANNLWEIFKKDIANTTKTFTRNKAGSTQSIGVIISSELGFTDNPNNNGGVEIGLNSFFTSYSDPDIKKYNNSAARPSSLVGGGILIADESRAYQPFNGSGIDTRLGGVVLKSFTDSSTNTIVGKISSYVSNDSSNTLVNRRLEINLKEGVSNAATVNNLVIINDGSVLLNKVSKLTSNYKLEVGGSAFIGDGNGFAFGTNYSQYIQGKLLTGNGFSGEENAQFSVKSKDTSSVSLGNSFFNHINSNASSKNIIVKALSKDNTVTSANYKTGGAIFEEEVLKYTSGSIASSTEAPVQYTTFGSPKFLSNNVLYPNQGNISTSKKIVTKGTITGVSGNVYGVNHGYNTDNPAGQLSLGSVYTNDTTYSPYAAQVVLENRAFSDSTGTINFESNTDFLLGYNMNFSSTANILSRSKKIVGSATTYMPSNGILFSKGNVHFPILGSEDYMGGGTDSEFKGRSALTLTPYGTASIGRTYENITDYNDFYDQPVNTLHIGKYFSFTDGREFGETNNNAAPGNSGLLFNASRIGSQYEKFNSSYGKGLIFDEVNNAVRISKITDTGNEIPQLSIYSGLDASGSANDNSGSPRILVGNYNTFAGRVNGVNGEVARRGTLNIRGRQKYSSSSPKDIFNIVLSEESKKKIGGTYNVANQGSDLFGIAAYNGFLTTDGSGNTTGITDSTVMNWFRIDSLYDRYDSGTSLSNIEVEGKSLFSIGDYKKGTRKESITNFGYSGARLFLGLNTSNGNLDGTSDMYSTDSKILESWKKYGRVYLESPYSNIQFVDNFNGDYELPNIVSKDGSILLLTDANKVVGANNIDWAVDRYSNFDNTSSRYTRAGAKLQFGSYNSNIGESNYKEGVPEFEFAYIPPYVNQDTNRSSKTSQLVIQRTNNNIIDDLDAQNDYRQFATRYMTFTSGQTTESTHSEVGPHIVSNARMIFMDGIGSSNSLLISEGATEDMIPVYQPLKIYSRLHSHCSLAYNKVGLLNSGKALDAISNTADNTYEQNYITSFGSIGRAYLKGNSSDFRWKDGFTSADNYKGGSDNSWNTGGTSKDISVAIMAYGRIFSNHSIISLSDKTEKNHYGEIDIYASLEAIEKLNPVYFSYKNNPSVLSAGFYAQDVEEVIPGAVSKLDISDHENKEETEEKVRLTLDYNGIYTHAIAAMQVLIKENKEKTETISLLEERLNVLTDKFNELESKISLL